MKQKFKMTVRRKDMQKTGCVSLSKVMETDTKTGGGW